MTMLDKIAITVGAIFMVGASPFVIDHVVNHWNEPEYPHSGFGPDCPEWVAPEDEDLYLPEAETDR